MKKAIVSLNSMYRCGSSTFIYHFAHDSDWEVLSFSKDGFRLDNDLPPMANNTYYKDSDAKVLEEFDMVLFAAPRWGGNYNFLDGLLLNKVGVVNHDENDWDRMGLMDLITTVRARSVFSCDKNLDQDGITSLDLPFSLSLLPVKKTTTYNGTFVVHSRPTPSKQHRVIESVLSGFPVNFASKDGRVYSWLELAELCSISSGIVDYWSLPGPYHGVSYTALEAWFYKKPFVGNRKYFDDEELLEGLTCMNFSRENVEELFVNKGLSRFIGENGYDNLERYHNPDTIRRIVEDRLLSKRLRQYQA